MVCSVSNLYDAWREFRKGKTQRVDIQQFEITLENNIFAIHTNLKTGSYAPLPYESFFVKDPKLRHIHKASVVDRVVHQALFRQLYPLINKTMSSSVYSARKTYGTHKGVKKLLDAVRKESHNWNKSTWILKCDIRKFFDSIDHGILKKKISRLDIDEHTTQLIYVILDSFEKSKGKGLPLGNVTSQLFANVYLDDFDWWIKKTLNIQYYFRYCDDFIIVLPEKNTAEKLIPLLKEKLREVALELHPQKLSIRKARQGVDFLGYVIVPHAVVMRTNTKKRVYRKIEEIWQGYEKGIVAKAKTMALFDSYLGVAGYAHSRKLVKHILRYKAVIDDSK